MATGKTHTPEFSGRRSRLDAIGEGTARAGLSMSERVKAIGPNEPANGAHPNRISTRNRAAVENMATAFTRRGADPGARHYIPGLPRGPERLLAVARAHRAIGNSLHWVLDVAMNEDRARNRTGNGPGNLAIPGRIAPNLARSEPSKGSMRGKRKRPGRNDNFILDPVRGAARIQKRLPGFFAKPPCPAAQSQVNALIRPPWRGAGVVERGGLENRCGGNPTQGSNPCLSAISF